MNIPDSALRPQIQKFYLSLRNNDIEELDVLSSKGLPLLWIQSFAETSLPEYAMKNGSVEAAWWLMAKGVLPENWAAFTGSATSNFFKKGLALVVSRQGQSIPIDVYKKIVKLAFKTTGENIPSWLNQFTGSSMSNAADTASKLFGRIGQHFDKLIKSTINEVTKDDNFKNDQSEKTFDDAPNIKNKEPVEQIVTKAVFTSSIKNRRQKKLTNTIEKDTKKSVNKINKKII